MGPFNIYTFVTLNVLEHLFLKIYPVFMSFKRTLSVVKNFKLEWWVHLAFWEWTDGVVYSIDVPKSNEVYQGVYN